ncbi:MAG: right-handed parallel beta-helix repeat-containing protein [Tissierellia bacterium]|nr:right-handed parallel beta-helix repeat-containing protein [Tissierellia bacterium]
MAIINVTPLTDISSLINSDSVTEGDVLLLEEGIYFQSVAVLKNNIRIVAKGPGVIFDGRSTLLDAFISNKAIGNRNNGLEIYGTNNLLLDKVLIDNGQGVIISGGNGSVAIGNFIRGTKLGTYEIFDGYSNHFVGENHIVCNRTEGIDNNGQFNIFLDNEILNNGDTGILLGTNSILNLVMDNELVCNIPENIDDRGIDNYLINNTEKPCGPCESPSEVCDNFPEEDNSINEPREGEN